VTNRFSGFHPWKILTLSLFFLLALPAANARPTTVITDGRNLLVNGKPFTIKGVGYAPVPVGIDPEAVPPYGDYYTLDQSAIYLRDLPLLRDMHANTIRLWGWNNEADHTDFLDRAYNNGKRPLYVIVTFWMALDLDLSDDETKTDLKNDFQAMVAAHKNHPAVLMWSIGNELNASGTYEGNLPALFSLLNEMAQLAHTEEGMNPHPVTTPLADSNLISTISTYDPGMTNLDVWSVQVYRGSSFGTLFSDYQAVSTKPLAILEYGIDAYDDQNGDEYETLGTAHQADYAKSLWNEIARNSPVCTGGSIMAYSDEWWKGKYGKTEEGHLTCPDYDPSLHSPCGYAAPSHPDGYANEEWWGIMRTQDNGAEPDIMQPRAVYYTLKSLWAPIGTPWLRLLLF